MQKVCCVIFDKYRKFKKFKILSILEKKFVLFVICNSWERKWITYLKKNNQLRC